MPFHTSRTAISKNALKTLPRHLRQNATAYLVLFISLVPVMIGFVRAREMVALWETGSHLPGGHSLPIWVLAGGVTVSLLLFILSWTETRRRREAERLNLTVRASEEALRESNKQLEQKIDESRKASEALKEAHQFNVEIISNAQMGIIVYDTDLRYAVWNKFMENLVGVKATEVIGRKFGETFSQLATPELVNNLRRALAGELVYATDTRYALGVAARERWLTGTCSPHRDASGKIIGVVVLVYDITERKFAEAALAESNSLLRGTLDSTADGILVIGPVGKILAYNQKFLSVWGIPESIARESDDALLGFVAGQLVEPDRFLDKVKAIYADPEASGFDLVEFKDGRFLERFTQPQNIGEKYLGRVWSFRDVTDREKIRRGLEEGQRRLELQQSALVQLAKSPAFRAGDLDALLHSLCRTTARVLDVDRVGVWEFSGERTRLRCVEQFDRAQADAPRGGDLAVLDYPVYFRALELDRVIAAEDARRDPQTGEFLSSYLRPLGITSMIDAPVRLEGLAIGVLCCESRGPLRPWTLDERNFAASLADLVALAIESRERKAMEVALAAEKERLAVTLRSIADAVVGTDTMGRIALFNPVAEILTGWTQTEALGHFLRDVFVLLDPKTRQAATDPATEVINRGDIVGGSHHRVLRARDGRERPVAHTAAPIRDRDGKLLGVVLVFRDITEKERLDAEVLKVNKLESIGLLAGGIAHDFNNILTAILGNLTLAKMASDSVEKLLRRVSDAERAANRARDLTQQLLTFAKGGAPIKKAVALEALIRHATQLALSGSNVQPDFSMASDLWLADVDDAQIRHVVQSVVLNARDAMPNGGLLLARAENVEISDDFLPPLPAGRYVKIVMRDQGPGIANEHLSKIFDPYFTTKERRSGMGLATAYSVVRKHDGQIKVDSELGRGTAVSVYLPASRLRSAPEVEVPTKSALPQGRRILVMDDEEDVRLVSCMILESMGCQVEVVADGAAAIESYLLARRRGNPFDVVVMDLTIANGLGGQETIRRLRELDPSVKAIVSSGYSFDPVMANHRAFGFMGVVPKPYEAEQLVKVLADVLNGSKEANPDCPK
jgi:PAS domain S-box-containing protein